jgi:hypothetical protein
MKQQFVSLVQEFGQKRGDVLEPSLVQARFNGLYEEKQENGTKMLVYGRMEEYDGGLDALVGKPSEHKFLRQMKWEHIKSPYASTPFGPGKEKTTAAEEYDLAMKGFPEQETDWGTIRCCQGLERLFQISQSDERIKQAELTREEVLALSLYTGRCSFCVWFMV